MMGIVMMIGIVVNNAILIVDQFNVHVARGSAAAQGDDRRRLRAVPPRRDDYRWRPCWACSRWRWVAGIGAEMRNGVGIASVGGILVSGVLTLVVLPILYDLFTRKKKSPAA